MSVSMVSHSQYLCPDYLTPIPNTMENGKSPLALLAQTCNSIGMPDPPSRGKTILPASEKSLSPVNSVKKENSDSKSGVKSEQSLSGDEKSPNKDNSNVKNERSNSTGGTTDENCNRRSKDNGTSDSGKADSRPTSAPTESRNSGGTSTTQAVPPTVPSLPSTSRGFPTLPPGCPPITGFPFSLPTSSVYPHGALSLPVPSVYSGIPSLTAASLPRFCMDPTCKSCTPNLGGGRSTCPLGCTQCNSHSVADLTTMWLANSYSSFLHGFPPSPAGVSLPGIGSTNGINAPLPGTVPSLSGSSGTGQIVCNWVTDRALGKLCLKCFTSPDDLLQHMRTHTSQDAGKAEVAPNPLLSFTSPLGAPAPGHISGRVSPRTAYWNALRYHPYSKLSGPTGFSGSLNPSLAANPHLLFPPTLNPAGYSAALSSLYAGQRLPGSLPHP